MSINTVLLTVSPIVSSAIFAPPSSLNFKNLMHGTWTVSVGTSSNYILTTYSVVSPCAPITGTVVIAATATLRNNLFLPAWITFESAILVLRASSASVPGNYHIIVEVTYDSLQSLTYDVELTCLSHESSGSQLIT